MKNQDEAFMAGKIIKFVDGAIETLSQHKYLNATVTAIDHKTNYADSLHAKSKLCRSHPLALAMNVEKFPSNLNWSVFAVRSRNHKSIIFLTYLVLPFNYIIT